MRKYVLVGFVFGISMLALLGLRMKSEVLPVANDYMVNFDHCAVGVSSTTQTLLYVPAFPDSQTIYIRNIDPFKKIYIGNSDVTTTTAAATCGYELAPSTGTGCFVTLNIHNPIYGIAETGQNISSVTIMMGNWE